MPDTTNNSYGGTYYNSPQQPTQPYQSGYVGSYNNLPSGISNAGGGNYNAYTGQVQDNSLVSNQLQGLLSSNSPYMQQAAQAGMNTANSRGLLNSSMAAGNAQAAAIQAGLPIAQQDASTYNQQQLANQQALNQILQQNMQDTTSQNVANTSASAQLGSTRMNNQGALARQREQLAYGGEQAGLNRNYGEYMSDLAYQQGLGNQAFSLAGNMMLNNQNFRNSAGMNAMNNPFLLQNPSSLGGYMDWIGGDYSNNINDLLGYSFGGQY